MSSGRVALCSVAVLLGCRAPPSSTTDQSCQTTIPVEPIKTDILLVVDNSCSMTNKQTLLANGLASFATRLAGAAVKQDFQVGVVTTSVIQLVQGYPQYDVNYDVAGWWGPAQAGRLQQATRADGTLTPKIMKYDDPTFLSDFQTVVKVGTTGSGEETEFEPVRLAISDPLISTPLDQGGNQGLLRSGARFLIFAITDEDDCSEIAGSNGSPGYDVYIGIDKSQIDYCYQAANLLTPPQAYADVFQQLSEAQGSTDVFFAAIAPVDVAPPHLAVQAPDAGTLQAAGCPISDGVGRRLREMAYIYDPAGQNLDSICDATYADTLVQLADFISTPQLIELAVAPPDGRMVIVDITRADGSVERCSVANGGIAYAGPSGNLPARVSFVGSCQRRADDQKVAVNLICAG